MQRTISAPRPRGLGGRAAGLVSGLNATPTASPSARARVGDRGRVVTASTWKVTESAPGRGELLEVVRRVVDHQVAVEHAAGGVDPRRDRAQHDGPDRHRRNEVPVTAVEVEHAAARLEQRRRSARRAARKSAA